MTDQIRSEVVVYGFADTHQLLKKARKVDKRADILSSDSFTLHHKHGHKHNKIHHKHRYSSNGYGLSAMLRGLSSGHSSHGHYPVEIVGSPRYNSSFHQASSGYGSRYGSIDPAADYRHGRHNGMYRPELDYRPRFDDGYRSEPDRYRPQHLEFQGVYDQYRPDLDYRPDLHDSRYRYGGYRPSQSYPSRLASERDYRDSLYPDAVMNPDYLKQMDYY